jgi:hypothetical protein
MHVPPIAKSSHYAYYLLEPSLATVGRATVLEKPINLLITDTRSTHHITIYCGV